MIDQKDQPTRPVSPLASFVFDTAMALARAGQPVPALPDLDQLREADGPDEESPLPSTPIRHVVAQATPRAEYGKDATVGMIIEQATTLRELGHATAIRWIRDSHRNIVGIQLSTYEAR